MRRSPATQNKTKFTWSTPVGIFVPRTLSARLIGTFVTFVAAGSLVLLLWLDAQERNASRKQFHALGKTVAEFIRVQNLPMTERTASSLSAILGVTVLVWENDAAAREAVAARFDRNTEPGNPPRKLDDSSVEYWATNSRADVAEVLKRKYGKAFRYALNNPDEVRTWGRGEAVHFTLGPWRHVALYREVESPPLQLRPWNLVVLLVFWLLSLALAFTLARGIVRPLRSLAAHLPRIAEESDDPIPETARPDEIGQLARAYAHTRALLAAERRAREQAERMAALGKLATGLAHEINNPVAAITLHTQLLEEETRADCAADAAPQRAALERIGIILAETAKIESLVSQWMFLARPQPPQTARCDFADILAPCLRSLAPAAAHAGVRIVNEVPPGLLVNADRRRFAQAVTNVITNAIHAMAAHGGTLTIRRTSGEHPTSNDTDSAPAAPGAGFDPRPSTFDIAFTDTGPGFSTEALARGTELFFSEKEGGMGVGLSVTAGILKAHGGHLCLANAADGGAVVTFVLPAAL